MRWWVACAVAGCYAPRVSPGAPCDPAHPACPDGQSCVDNAGAFACEPPGTGMPIDAPPVLDGSLADGDGADGAVTDGTNDVDGDGVADNVDNCPTIANHYQENEDGDRFGDACDPCPPVADDNPPDSDMDGVADQCDPNPNTPGDHIVLFEGFARGIPAGWIQTGGTWTAGGGNVSITAAGSTLGAALTIVDPSQSTHETVAAAMVFDDPGSGAGSRIAGVAADAEHTGLTGVGCGMYLENSQSKVAIAELPTVQVLAQGLINLAPGNAALVSERRDGNAYKCTMVTLQGGNQVMATDQLATATPEVGFGTIGVGATFSWILVIAN